MDELAQLTKFCRGLGAEPAQAGVGIEVDDEHGDVVEPAVPVGLVRRRNGALQRQAQQVGFESCDTHDTPSHGWC